NKVGEFKLESGTLSVDNDIMITGSTTGIIMTKIQELRMDDLPVTTVKKGDVFSMPVTEKIKPSDKLYKIIND
ncbi:MAG TPA: U32 family peptidase, partial [Bacteroidia bacterium]|nr:U32 family peptidase [Bacteroidia bacterium]